MWNRVGVLALIMPILAALLSGCQECSSADDCTRRRGPPPAGQQWVCNAGMCEGSGGPGTDGGTNGGTDGGTDGGVSGPSQQISIVRSTPEGTGLTLPIEGAFVTYKRTALGSDPKGFFLQADPDGPALFVSDAAATDQVKVGDKVNLTVTGKVVTSSVQVASAVTGLTVVSSDNPVQNLATDTPPGLAVDRSSAADLVTNINNYESELVRLSGEVSGPSRGAGGSFTAFPLKTAGIATAPTTGAFELRMPTTLGENLDLGQGCTLTLKAGPMWRFNANAQPSAYEASDLTVDCPAPTLSAAAPLSSNRVLLTFDRRIDDTSITDVATQFTFNNGVTASAATVNGRQVTLTTSEMTAGTSYTVTVADSVKGTSGKAVAAPNNTATFTGLVQLAARGARLQVTGSGFTGATAVTLGGVSQTFNVDSDTAITLTAVADATPVGNQPIVVTTPGGDVAAGSITVINLVINELDADTPSADVAEFIEIATGVPDLNLTGAGFSVVFFNGSTDTSYYALDVAGVTNSEGLLVVGNAGVTPTPAVTWADNLLQNGADAVGLYQAPASAFQNETAVTANNLIDALVYDTADADDSGLLGTLLVSGGQTQVDEVTPDSPSANNSIQRCGSARRDGRVFSKVAAPTPGAPNGCP